jgi:hypothetical protein
MSKKKEFKNAVAKPTTINDSRFGIRRIFLTKQERPRIGTYMNAGRGQNGESQN